MNQSLRVFHAQAVDVTYRGMFFDPAYDQDEDPEAVLRDLCPHSDQ